VKITIAAVGRMKPGAERELAQRYLGLAGAAGRALGLTGFETQEHKESRAGAAAARKLDEARQIEAALPAGGTVMALHETGASMTSTDLAGWIGALRDSGTPHLTFLIGGADGLDPALLRRADRMLSFSALTWPHQLVCIMLAEQLYRVTTILSGHPYHRQ